MSPLNPNVYLVHCVGKDSTKLTNNDEVCFMHIIPTVVHNQLMPMDEVCFMHIILGVVHNQLMSMDDYVGCSLLCTKAS